MSKVTRTKPQKPSPDFPLFPHACGKWAKKILGRLVYFGRWEDPDGALAAYKQYAADSKPKLRGKPTVEEACNGFLGAKCDAVERGELAKVSFQDYHRTGRFIADQLGRNTTIESLCPSDFQRLKLAMAERRNVVGVSNEITRVRTLFKWAYDMGMITRPVQFGPEFKKASAKVLRRHRRLTGKKLFTAEQIRRVIRESGDNLRAMIYLGINCGFGTNDCSTLPLEAVDFKTGWVHYPRPKTEVERDVPLWPETVEALHVARAFRHQPMSGAEDRFFVLPNGGIWEANHTLSRYFGQALRHAWIRRGTFYWLRHTFATVAGGSKDQVAVNSIMGHVDGTMAATYREEIHPARLQAVVNYVHRWLQPTSPSAGQLSSLEVGTFLPHSAKENSNGRSVFQDRRDSRPISGESSDGVLVDNEGRTRGDRRLAGGRAVSELQNQGEYDLSVRATTVSAAEANAPGPDDAADQEVRLS